MVGTKDPKMVITLFAVGLIIGFVIGLTGAGGALITMPIFMQLYHLDVKEASFYSLLAVILGAIINFLFQYREAKVNLGAGLCFASLVGSWLSQPLKAEIPDSLLSILIAVLACYSLYGVWVPRKITNSEVSKPRTFLFTVFTTVMIGFFLGGLTTFTGLGGGVIILPILLSYYDLSQARAVATSLLVVTISSMTSFVIQLARLQQSQGVQFPFSQAEILALTCGILLMAYTLKKILTRIPSEWSSHLRKVTFTAVVGLALSKLVANI